ncbi:SGNH/GDSL hydrolase family protein [Nonomuraea sp. NPDC050663]|uniref:SGNH/GDSL hydrolase family protein n=1 Tax=Nonomuraea sp. NPDC050663 TaxID=3364370 RepID=UPI00379CB1E0
MPFLRYVALGDSQTEGLNDGDPLTGYRGWADRLAELLAEADGQVQYANLAVRGKLAAHVRAEQLPAALELRPDLVTVMAGMNDLIRPSFDADAVTGHLEAMFAALRGTPPASLMEAAPTVVTFTFPDIGRIAPIVKRLRPRLLDFNDRVRAAAARHGVLVVDAYPHDVTCDPRMWSSDRIHATPRGHALIAAAVADTLALPGSDPSWTQPLMPLPLVPAWRRAATEAAWLGTFVGPWMVRRLRGRSSADGRTAKRPLLLPVRD